jgi:translocation and assembly module TamB
MHWQPGHQLQGNVSLLLTTHGQHGVGNLQIQQLQGNWQNRPVTGNVMIVIEPHRFDIKQLNLAIADASLQSSGQIHGNGLLQWQLSIPNLQRLLPNAQGKIYSQGKLYYDRQVLQGNAQLNAANLKIDEHQLELLQANIKLNTPVNTQVSLSAQQYHYGSLVIQKLGLQANGSLQTQQFKLAMQTPTQKLELAGTSQLLQQVWQANLTSGHWQALGLSSQKIDLPIFGQVNVNPNNRNLTLQCELNTAQQEQLSALLSLPNYQFGQAINPKQPITGQLNLRINQLQHLPLPYFAGGSFQLITNINGTISAPKIQGQAKLANAVMPLPQLGIKLQDLNLLAQGDSMGNIHIQGQAVSAPGRLFIQGLLKPTGDDWQSDMHITGKQFLTYKTPEYLIYTSPDLHLTSSGKQLNLQGTVIIPKAHIVTLENKLKDKQRIIKPSDDVEYADTKKEVIPLKLSSHLHLVLGDDIFIDMHGLTGQLKGQLLIQENSNSAATGIGEISIQNGQYQAYGQRLTIRQGRLIFRANPLTNPGLNIEAIKKIRLTPTAADRASLFALQKDTLVGIIVRGTLLAPQAQLFADPANLTQTDILSYLLFDKPSHESANPQALLQLATSLSSGGGISKLDHLKERLQQNIGLDELNVETDSTANPSQDNPNQTKQNTSLALGKALSPRLYLRYSMGLLEPINTLTIRYLLSSKWTLQSSSSTTDNGIDLLYEIER